MEKIERPIFVEDYHLEFLDELRKTGQVNMFGSAQYLLGAFEDLSKEQARLTVAYWMKTFHLREKGA